MMFIHFVDLVFVYTNIYPNLIVWAMIDSKMMMRSSHVRVDVVDEDTGNFDRE